jgi:hypothetical protein
MLTIPPKPKYDEDNEFEYREDVRRKLGQTYKTTGDLTVPFGKSLAFTSAQGQVITFGYNAGGEFTIQQNTSTPFSLASISYVTSVESGLSGSISTVSTEVVAARSGEASLLARIGTVNTAAVNAASAAATAQSEITAAREGETSLIAKINTMESATATADSAAATAQSEITAARSGEASLVARIGTVNTTAVNAASAASTAQSEITAARSGEASLSARIGTVNTAAVNAGSAASTAQSEITAARSGEVSLSARIGTVNTAAVNAGSAASTAQSEITAARNGEASLSARIGTVNTTAVNASDAASTAQSEITAARSGEATLSARIGAVNTTAVNASSAASTAQSEITAARNGSASLLARINSVAQTVVDEASARSSVDTVISAQVGGASAAINTSPNFADNANATGVPTNWTDWVLASANTSRSTGVSPQPYAITMNGVAGQQTGIRQVLSGLALPAGWYVLEADAELISGTFVGAGVFVYSQQGASDTDIRISFETDPDVSGAAPGNGSTGKIYRWRKLVQFTHTTPNGGWPAIYAVTHWDPLGSNANANSVKFHRAAIRAASQAEIEARQAKLDLVTANAAITANQSAQAGINSAQATTNTTLTAQVGGAASGPAINSSPNFADNANATGVPTNWANWTNGSGTRVTGIAPQPYAFTLAGGAGAQAGISQFRAGALTKGFYVIEADVTLNSGAFTGAGVWVDWQVATVGAGAAVVFATDPDVTGSAVGAGTTGRLYRWRKLVEVPGVPDNGHTSIYAMSHWDGHGSIAAANSITWHRCAIRAASQAEIEARQAKLDLVTANAAITANQSAQAGVNSAQAATNSTLSAQVVGAASGAAINTSPNFSDNVNATGVPTNWFEWTNATADGTRQTGIAPQPYAYQQAGRAGENGGVYQPMFGRFSAGWHVIEADITLVSGALTGAGVILNADPGGAYTEYRLIFSTDADVNGSVVGAGTVGALYKFRKLVQVGRGDTYNHIYAMSHYSALGSIASANSIKFHRAAVRAASQAEIEARQAKNDLVTTNANVASNTEAIASNTASIASQGSAITTNFVKATDVGVNLVPNSTGLRGKTGWEGAAANWGTYEHPLWGHWFNRVFTGATVTEDFYTSQITANPGEQYSLSFVPYISGLSSGSIRIYVAWYNSGGTYINEGPSIYLGPSVHRVRQYIEAIAAPAGTAFMRFVVVMSGAVGAGGYAETGFWQAKIEQGIRATAWRADGDLINNFARLTSAEASIVTNASAIATETSARTSADTTLTANFTALRSGNDADSLPSTFEKDDLYWESNNNSFVTEAGIGRVYQATSGGHFIKTRGKIQVNPNRTYRITSRHRVKTNTTNGINPKPLTGIRGFDTAGNTTGNGHWVGSFVQRTTSDGWVTVTGQFTTAEILTLQTEVVSIEAYAEPNWSDLGTSNAVTQVQFLKLEDVTDITTTNATVASNTSAIATETSARAAADTTLSAKINVNGNRFPHPQPLSTTLPAGWVGTGLEVGTWQPLGGNFYYRPRSSGGSATTEYYYYDVEPTASAWVSTGEQYTLSAVGYGGAGTAGDRLRMWLEYYNSSNTLIYSSPQVLLAAYAPPERYSTTAAFTSGGEYVRRRVVFAREWAASGSYQDTVFNYIKLERGPIATAYTADGALTPLQASVTTNASAIATVDGKLSASYALTVDGGGRIASMKLLSDGATSSVKFTASTFQVYNGTTDEAPFEVSGGVVKIKTANVGVLTAGNISVSSLSSLSANLGSITAGDIDLTSGSYVVRQGAGFGVSSDLVLWYGLSSVARASATKTNGVFAMATDGKVYYGAAELGRTPPTVSRTNGFIKIKIGSGTNTTDSVTFTGAGGSGSGYTFAHELITTSTTGPSPTISFSTGSPITVSATGGVVGDEVRGIVVTTVTDGAGAKAQLISPVALLWES